MKPYDDMNGVEVLWHLLSNWEAGRGLWFIIGFAVIAIIISWWCDKHMEDTPNITHIDYWGHNR